MPIYWNDIEILHALDAHGRGEPPHFFTGFELMHALATAHDAALAEQDYHSFLRELFVLGKAELLTWELTVLPSQVRQLDPREPNGFLQNMRDLALTVRGRDRARGQIVQLPLDDPHEDDGRPFRSSTLEDVAQIIGDGASTAAEVESTGRLYGVKFRIAVNGVNGNVYVTSFFGVEVFNDNWEYVSGLGGSTEPGGIGVDAATGEVFVSVDAEHEVARFSVAGESLGRLDASDTPTGSFGVPLGIAVAGNGSVFVVDAAGKALDVFEAGQTPEAPGTESSTDVSAGTALLRGSLPESAKPVEFYFVYNVGPVCTGPTSAATTVDNGGEPVSGSHPTAVSAEVTSLKQGTPYTACLVGSNPFGRTVGTPSHFTTESLSAVTGEASKISQTLVSVTGTVNPRGVVSSYYYEYGPNSRYGETTPMLALGGGEAPMPAPDTLQDLVPGTTYHYRLVGRNEDDVSYGEDHEFTTVADLAPSATTGLASDVSSDSATIAGAVNPQGVPTSYEFEFGTDTNYGAQVYASAGESDELNAVTLSVEGLQSDTTYHFRLCATNEANTFSPVCGADGTFTTTVVSTGPPAPVALNLLSPPAFAFPLEEAGITGAPPSIVVVRQSSTADSAKVIVRVPSAGRLTATGAGISPDVTRVRSAKTLTLRLGLAGKDRSLLARHPGRRLMLKVRLRFQPTHGASLTKSIKVLIG